MNVALLILALSPSQLELLPAQLRRDWAVTERPEPRAFRTGESDEEVYDAEKRILYVWTATVSRSTADARAERVRAVLASAIYAFDGEAKWSEQLAWKSLSSWRGVMSTVMDPLPHAANEHPAGFADERGRRSPRWELASFAARYFSGDEATKCRLLAHSRFLSDRLQELGIEPPHPRCPAFDRWADLARLETIEVALATPTSQTVGSLFGHLFLRVQTAENRVIAFLAESSGIIEDDPFYPVKGIFGGYRASLFEKSFLDVYRDYVIAESRSIRRFRVNLEGEAARRLLERLYTRLHTAHYTYYFFAQNCATLLLDIFNGIAPGLEELRAEGSLGRGPSSVLDALTKTPLLTYVPEPYASFEVEAAEAMIERDTLSLRLSEHAPELAYAFDITKSSNDALLRATAYQRLQPVFADAQRTRAEDAASWMRASAKIEAYRSAKESVEAEKVISLERRRAQIEALDLYLGTGAVPVEIPDADEDARFLAYRAAASYLQQHDDDNFRAYVLLAADLAGDTIRRRDPQLHAQLFLPERDRPVLAQRFMQGRAQLVEPIAVTSVSPALLAVQRAKQAIAAQRSLPRDDPQAVTKIEEERAHYEAAYERTGIDTFGIGGGYDDGVPGLMLRGAAYEERLGDQRRHGFPGSTSFVFLRSEVLWTLQEKLPRVVSSETRFFGYRNVPAGRSLGFELAADLSTRGSVLTPRVGAGALWAIAASSSFADHLVLSTGVAYEPAFREQHQRDTHAAIAPLALEARKSLGGPMHALRGRAYFTPGFDLVGRDLSYRWGAEGELRIQVAGKVALLLRGRWDDQLGVLADAGVLFD